MEINTKFRPGDDIWYVNQLCHITQARVIEINVRVMDSTTTIINKTDTGDTASDSYAFRTKEELIKYINESK